MRSCCETDPGNAHDKHCPNWRLTPPKRSCCNTNASQAHRPSCDVNYVPDPPPAVDVVNILRLIRTTKKIADATGAAAHQFTATTNWHLERKDGQPGAASTDAGISSGGVSDPVGRLIEARFAAWDTWQSVEVHILEAIRNLKTAEAKMSYLERVDTSQEAARHRCTGGMGQPGGDRWGDPTCPRIGITEDGVCDPCDQRRAHWRKDPEGYLPRPARRRL